MSSVSIAQGMGGVSALKGRLSFYVAVYYFRKWNSHLESDRSTCIDWQSINFQIDIRKIWICILIAILLFCVAITCFIRRRFSWLFNGTQYPRYNEHWRRPPRAKHRRMVVHVALYSHVTSYIFIGIHPVNGFKAAMNDYKHIYQTWMYIIDFVVNYISNTHKSNSRNMTYKENSFVGDIPFCDYVGSLLRTTWPYDHIWHRRFISLEPVAYSQKTFLEVGIPFHLNMAKAFIRDGCVI